MSICSVKVLMVYSLCVLYSGTNHMGGPLHLPDLAKRAHAYILIIKTSFDILNAWRSLQPGGDHQEDVQKVPELLVARDELHLLRSGSDEDLKAEPA